MSNQSWRLAAAIAVVGLAMVACNREEQPPTVPPTPQTEGLDDAANEAGQALENAAAETKEAGAAALNETGKALENAGEALQEQAN